MKILFKIFAFIALFYAAICVSFALYFSYAADHEELLESNLSRVFDRPVTIGKVTTKWNGFSPRIKIQDFEVAGELPDLPALSFKSLAAEISGLSLLQFWPKFTEFAIHQPSLEIVTLSTNQLQIAGIPLKSGGAAGINPRRLISWMLNHESLVWHEGQIIWRRLDGETQRYHDISFVYQRTNLNRVVSATTQTPEGTLAFKAESNGEVLEADNWDASLVVLGNQGKRLLAPNDLTLLVENGTGQLTLKAMKVGQISDLLRLLGLGGGSNWLLDSKLKGRLHDVVFEFSGPLLELRDWSLQAYASEIEFNSVPPAPAMNNLSGQLHAASGSGAFQFSTSDALFDWPRWFDKPFNISKASGELRWAVEDSGKIKLSLHDVELADDALTIERLNANIDIDKVSRSVSSFGQLFKLESIADLSYEAGEIVKTADTTDTLRPLFLEASARFSMSDMSLVNRYLPNDKRLDKFRLWWENALLAGEVKNGLIRYNGELSKNAMYVGRASLLGTAEYSGMEIDYGYQRNWPKVVKGRGSAILQNDLLVFNPDEIWLEDDQILQPKLQISSLFKLDRYLELSGSIDTSLSNSIDFLFDGPLIKRRDNGRPLPVAGDLGDVHIDVEVGIPLGKIRDTKVKGGARITGGRLLLPPKVPISDLSADIQFTEISVESDNIKGQFLGHPLRASLQTTEAAQPPKLALKASGSLDMNALEPWLGEHLLSWMSGTTKWQGVVSIDGPEVSIEAQSNLSGVEVTAPTPLNKAADAKRALNLSMQLGSLDKPQLLSVTAGQQMRASFESSASLIGTDSRGFLQKSLISIGERAVAVPKTKLKDGVHFLVKSKQLDLDQWLTALIDLAGLQTKPQDPPNTVFLDAMRTVTLEADDTSFLSRKFGDLSLSALSVDGSHWIGSLDGENLSGTLQATPRAEVSDYQFNLARFHLPEEKNAGSAPEPIDPTLSPSDYPSLSLTANSFRVGKKNLGKLVVSGKQNGEAWAVENFSLSDQGILTTAKGKWVNNAQRGTMSSFDFNTIIDEAGDVLDEMDFQGIIKRGQGTIKGNLNWIGAPHEFDYARLSGDFDLRITDGELVKVEPGGGKLLGLLNFNAIARRLTLDFRDIFASGLQFDRIRFAGILANGEAIMRDAFIFSPAVFVQMEGKIDLDNELIDMEMHMSPELGGNLTLLSALANPAAGAVVFLTQQIFKDEMRESSFQSYRALGSWRDFELEAIDRNGLSRAEKTQQSPAQVQGTTTE